MSKRITFKLSDFKEDKQQEIQNILKPDEISDVIFEITIDDIGGIYIEMIDEDKEDKGENNA